MRIFEKIRTKISTNSQFIYMNIFTFAFQEILYRPLLNLLIVFYQIPYFDFGGAILLLTLLIRILLWPLNSKVIKNQRESQVRAREIQEKLKEIQEKHKGDPVRQNEKIRELLKETKFNPFSGFLPIIIQIIILIALYQVLRNVLSPEGLSLLYSFIENPGKIEPTFFGILDLSKASSILAILTGVLQFFYSKMNLATGPKIKKEKKHLPKGAQEQKIKTMQKMMQNQMIYFMPIMTIFICWTLPAALPLYWLFSTLIGIFQQKMIFKKGNL